MGKEVRFQAAHSRNSHDFQYVRGPTGRLIFQANEGGVARRVGKIVGFLARRTSGATESAILDMLQKISASYSRNDLSQPLKQMYGLGIVRPISGPETIWRLTPQGRDIWKNVDIKWV